MKALSKVVSLLSLITFPCMYILGNESKGNIENGWYHVFENGKLSEKPIITVKEFVGLKLDKDYFGRYTIIGKISKHKLSKWAYETEKAIGKQIAFLFNDSIVSDPQVNGKIGTGIFMITSQNDKKLPEIYRQMVKEKSDSIDVLFRGWEKDSSYNELTPDQKDSVIMNIDYWEAKAWIDLSTKPEEHYWYSIQDSTEYKRLEKALIEEIEKVHFSSSASDYMKSEAYKAYKKYLHNNIDYINLMFKGFLFKDIKGLHGYLIDDIIQSKYPSAPSIRSYVDKIDNDDDEKFAIYKWQRKIWSLMNKMK